jgi:hypothetical protein
MWVVIIAIMMSLGSGHLRGYWQEDVCPVVNQNMPVYNQTMPVYNQTIPVYNQTASIKPWYRSAEEKEAAVRLGWTV